MGINQVMALLHGRYVMHENVAMRVAEVYGHKLLCVPQDADGDDTDEVVIIETTTGMVFHEDNPLLEDEEDGDEEKPAGPDLWRIVFAIQKLDDKGEQATLRSIAAYLGHEYNPTQKRTANLLRKLDKGMIETVKTSRGNIYRIKNPVAVARWLRDNG